MNIYQKAFGIITGAFIFAVLVGYLSIPHIIQFLVMTFFMTLWLFLAGIKAKGMYKRGELNTFMKYTLSPLVMCFILLDFTFNQTFGTFIFRELPKEALFTQRVQRHIKDKNNKLALFFAFILNAVEPGHINLN
jgi:hypothetical protein